MKTVRRILALWACFAVLAAPAADNMKAFPAAEAGMVRHVLQLPAQDDEADFKVELIAGRTLELDPGNQYFFSGSIAEETIQGWGFPRYVVSSLGSLAGTLMAIDPSQPKVDRFVALRGEAHLIRYNSRLPIVVYAPEGVEVRYRIWSASAQAKAIDRG